ncbi:hypothetical protein [Nocardia cyriacigeorgica]|uniref:hypothetical protein n=1 Tax=Nocardia cyriacigeorgica TaxID=135487 RepID=UPI001E3766E5|nr:hypothetical protein [Nocardia cyriacigeorgica]
MNITPDTAKLVYDRIVEGLNGLEDLVGVSCIARAADSVFAQAVLDCGGQLEVVLPSRNYRERKVKPDHAELFSTGCWPARRPSTSWISMMPAGRRTRPPMPNSCSAQIN